MQKEHIIMSISHSAPNIKDLNTDWKYAVVSITISDHESLLYSDLEPAFCETMTTSLIKVKSPDNNKELIYVPIVRYKTSFKRLSLSSTAKIEGELANILNSTIFLIIECEGKSLLMEKPTAESWYDYFINSISSVLPYSSGKEINMSKTNHINKIFDFARLYNAPALQSIQNMVFVAVDCIDMSPIERGLLGRETHKTLLSGWCRTLFYNDKSIQDVVNDLYKQFILVSLSHSSSDKDNEESFDNNIKYQSSF